MFASKSISKKVMLTKNSATNSKEKSSQGNEMRRFKSQETYSAAAAKNKTNEACKNEITILTKTNFNEFTYMSKSKELVRSNYKSKPFQLISITKKTPSQCEKVNSGMNAYLSNKPKNNLKEPTMVSKIMKDESIQELNTEENSMLYLTFSQ